MTNDNNQNTISSNQQQLMKYPSELIKKGLNLANKIQSPDLAKAELFLRLAVERAQGGDYQGALIGFEQALKINPNYYEVYILRSFLIYTPLGKYAAVINDYNQVLRLNPKNAEAYTNRGYAYASLGNYLEALRDYDRALKLDPHCVQTYINCGLSHVALQNYEKAIVDFTQALQINPRNADAYNNRGLSYCNLGNYKIALANFNQALKFAPNHINAYLNRGYTYIRLEQYLEGIADFNKAFKLDPQSSKQYFKHIEQQLGGALGYQNWEEFLNELNKKFSQELFDKGCDCNELGDFRGAIEAYTLALQINPKNIYSYNNRGLNYFCLGYYKDALYDFNQALQIKPDYTMAYLNRSRALMCLGEYLESIEDIEKALRLDPECCHQFFEEYSQNIHYLLRQSDKQTSQALLIHCIQGLLLQGKSRHDSGDYYEAIESYDQVISINPYISEVYRARSLSYSALGYLAEAMADLQRAMSID